MEVFPVKFVPYDVFEHTTDKCVQNLNGYLPIVKKIFEVLQDSSTPPEFQHASVRDFVINVGPRGIMTMLGMRNTVSSQDIPWPNMQELKDSFNALQTVRTEQELAAVSKASKVESKLSVGARALCKHAHRDVAKFWGDMKGSEATKNEMASAKMDVILAECVWVNIHVIVHGETLVEARIESGQGLRWAGDGSFRGFLEP